jgi:hypothetical protein
MGLFDGAFSAADDTGGFLSKLARQNRTPADTVAQRFPAAQPGWLAPASMLGGWAPLPLFPPLSTQPGAAAPQLQPVGDIGVAPGTDALAGRSVLAGPWTAFRQPDAPSIASGAAAGPWTAFQAQPSTIGAASNAVMTGPWEAFQQARAAAVPATGSSSALQPDQPISADDVVRSVGRGVPILGGLAARGNAAINATLSPLVASDQDQTVSHAPTWSERYAEDLARENARDAAYDVNHPTASTVGQLGGGIASTIATAGTATGAKLLGLTAKTLPGQIAAGGASNAGIGVLDALARGEDPWRAGEIGLGLGMAAPVAGRVIGSLVTGARNMLAPPRVPANTADVARVAGSAPEDLLASRSARLYNPPSVEQRPFSADYPGIARDDGTGRLTHDVEGRPLVAGRIVGRRTVGGADEALSPAELNAVATRITGNVPEAVASRQIGGNAGVFRIGFDRDGNPRYQILVDKALKPQVQDRVAAHETGHGLNYFGGYARDIPQAGLESELRYVYNDLNNPDLAQFRSQRGRDPELVGKYAGYGPEKQRYKPDKVPGELMAEAMRAYLVNPNYLKSVAPRTAAAIRAAVNAHPVLSRIVQFNAVPLAAGAAGLGARAVDSVGSSGGDDGTGRM